MEAVKPFWFFGIPGRAVYLMFVLAALVTLIASAFSYTSHPSFIQTIQTIVYATAFFGVGFGQSIKTLNEDAPWDILKAFAWFTVFVSIGIGGVVAAETNLVSKTAGAIGTILLTGFISELFGLLFEAVLFCIRMSVAWVLKRPKEK